MARGQVQRGGSSSQSDEPIGFGTPGGGSRQSLQNAGSNADRTLGNIDDVLNDTGSTVNPGAHSQFIPGGAGGKDRSGYDSGTYGHDRGGPATRPNLRHQENMGGGESNPNIKRGGLGVPLSTASKPSSTIKRGGLGATGAAARSPEQLEEEESNPEDDDLYNDSDKPRKKLSFRKNAAMTGSIVGIVGAGGLFGFGAMTAGPLQFIHLAQMLIGFHLDKHENQQRHRMGKLLQYFKGESEKQKKMPLTQQNRYRMGVLARVFSGRFELKLNKAGFTAVLGGDGKFTHWQIDAAKVLPDKDLKNMTEAEIRADLAGRLGTDMDAGGGKDHIFTVSPTANKLGYYRSGPFIKSMAKIAKYNGVLASLHSHQFGELTGFKGWHPMKAAKEKYKGKLTDEMKKGYSERLKKFVRGIGYKPSTIINRGSQDKSVTDVGALADGGYNSDPADPNIKKGIVEKLNDKFGPIKDDVSIKGLVLSVKVLEAVCGLYTIARLWDKIKFAVLAIPMMNMAMEAIATGNQIMDNDDPKSDTPELDMGKMAYMATLLHDNKTGSTWSDATSIQSQTGSNMGVDGPDDLPSYLKPGPDPTTTEILGVVNSGLVTASLGSTCALIGNTAFQVAFTVVDGIVTFLTLGGSKGVIEVVKEGAKILLKQVLKLVFTHLVAGAIKDSDVFKSLVEQLANFFAGVLVDPEAKGARRGGFMDYGAKMINNGNAMIDGGGALTTSQAAALDDAQKLINDREFAQKSFASRMFDTGDYRSAISRLIDSQAASPQAEFARMSNGFLNLGQTMASMPLKLLSSVTHAAPGKAYDYGFADYGFSEADMDDPALDNPYENAQIVHDIMGNQDMVGIAYPGRTVQQTYQQRVLYCYGINISMPAGPDDPLTTKTDTEFGAPDYATVQNYPRSVQIGGTAIDGLLLSNPATAVFEGPQLVLATSYFAGSDGVGGGTCRDANIEWKRIRMFLMDTNTMNAMACSDTHDADTKSKYEGDQAMAKEGGQACSDTGIGDSNASGGGDCAQGLPQGDDGPFHQIFSDDFTVNSAVGSWGTSDSSKVVYTGDHQGKWVEYPDGWNSTYGGGYAPATVLSTHDSYLDVFYNNNHGANPSPLIDGTSAYQTYGRYTICMKADPGLSGYYIVPLLWPQNEGDWSCAESDFPEGMADGEAGGFAHNCVNHQDAISTNGAKFTDWHVYTQDWEPGKRTYYVDGQKVGESTKAVYAGPERWQLQFEPNGGGPGGHLLVDWVAVYSLK